MGRGCMALNAIFIAAAIVGRVWESRGEGGSSVHPPFLDLVWLGPTYAPRYYRGHLARLQHPPQLFPLVESTLQSAGGRRGGERG